MDVKLNAIVFLLAAFLSACSVDDRSVIESIIYDEVEVLNEIAGFDFSRLRVYNRGRTTIYYFGDSIKVKVARTDRDEPVGVMKLVDGQTVLNKEYYGNTKQLISHQTYKNGKLDGTYKY